MIEKFIVFILTSLLVPTIALYVYLRGVMRGNIGNIINRHYKNYFLFGSDFDSPEFQPLDPTKRIAFALKLSKWIHFITNHDFAMRLTQLEECIAYDNTFLKWASDNPNDAFNSKPENKEIKQKFSDHFNNTLIFYFNVELLLRKRSEVKTMLNKFKADTNYVYDVSDGYYKSYTTVSYNPDEGTSSAKN